MAFDQSTRNRLSRFVGDARDLLTTEFARQCQNDYGLDPATGVAAELGALTQLDDAKRETARLLRDTLAHYLAAAPGAEAAARKEALVRIVREQAFTVLNRLCALRLAEARGLLVESVAKGYTSKGFQLYAQLAGPGLGETGDAYATYLFSVFDEFAVDLPVLFDRFSPSGRLFPRETVLLVLLAAINDPELEPLWAEDETIGWIYQYFNSKDERKAMRDASAAPRNSRELAVRNQFFTPRYVVEFLTDNTLGRIWYEMTQGQTGLKEQCRYLVRRPIEIFLANPTQAHDWIFGSPFDGQYRMSEDVEAAFRGDLSLLTDDDGPNSRWISVAIHPNQYERITGETYQPYDDERLGSVLHSVHDGRYSADTENIAVLWAAISHFTLNDFGRTYSIAPWRKLWSRFVEVARRVSRPERSQEDLLNQPVFIPHRVLKDPREILMLDPACGSMHFGLYAFDLFERIYEEAWEMQSDGRWQGASGRRLIEDYPTKDALLRDVPRLILERNIHGIDIDPRAVQIAGLSLWLRAQRSWHAQGLHLEQRPAITRSNIVCAEPMPGETAFLEEFLATTLSSSPEDRLLGQIVRRAFEAMKLAGEAGSLLKIEEEIAGAVAVAKQKWQATPVERPLLIDVAPVKPTQAELGLDVRGITDEAFWDLAEENIYGALRDYAERAAKDSLQKRLFAEDVARGFAFIDISRRRYEAIVMNPPFGRGLSATEDYLRRSYVGSGSEELASSFYSRALGMLSSMGRLGEISSRTPFYLQSLADWRTSILFGQSTLDAFVDLGIDVLDDATNETSAYVSQNSRDDSHTCLFGMFHRTDDVELALDDLAHYRARREIIIRPLADFQVLADAPLSYWVSAAFVGTLHGLRPMGEHAASIQMGLAPRDEFRFSRLWWEVGPADIGQGLLWIGYAKGGELSPYYSDVELLLNAADDLAEIKAALNGKYPYLRGNLGWVLHPENSYFMAGLTFGQRTAFLRVSVLPANCYFSVAGKGIFGRRQSSSSLLQSINTPAAQFLVGLRRESLIMHPQFQEGDVTRMPWPELTDQDMAKLETLAMETLSRVRAVASFNEVDHAFTACSTGEATRRTYEHASSVIDRNESKANALLCGLLNLSPTDNDFIEREIIPEWHSRSVANWFVPKETTDFISYFLGASFGRWDIRFATGERPAPELPDPFAPLPVCPPGMLQNAAGLPAAPADVPADYPLRITWGGILPDDAGHPDDIERRVRDALRVIWVERADAIEQEACEILGVKTLRDYFRKPGLFFADHLKRYSKSRRQAPIYWPLSTASGSYTLWLYYHRLSDQTLYTCVNDFVEPRLKVVVEQAAGLARKTGRSGKDEEELEQLTALEAELKDFRAELLRVAAFWKPNLNDGVQITATPLWRLFQFKPWQKKLKETWAALEAGDYDWAHMAHSVWPARVREKCKTDKSLAIAHDLEAVYIEPPASAKKKAGRKKKVETETETLLDEDEG